MASAMPSLAPVTIATEPASRPAPGTSDAFDDAQVALRAVRKRLERRLIPRRIVTRQRLLHAVELDHHRALVRAGFVGFRAPAAPKKPTACSLYRRSSKLRV